MSVSKFQPLFIASTLAGLLAGCAEIPLVGGRGQVHGAAQRRQGLSAAAQQQRWEDCKDDRWELSRHGHRASIVRFV